MFGQFDVIQFWMSAWNISDREGMTYPSVQTLILTTGCMENGQKSVEGLPTEKIYFNFGTNLVQIGLV